MAIKISKNRLDLDSKPVQNVLTVQIGASPTLGTSPETGVTGLTTPLLANQDTVLGDVCYIVATGPLGNRIPAAQLADADALSTSYAFIIGAATISVSNSGNFLLRGIVVNGNWSWTPGGLLYLSTTAGSMTQTRPGGVDDTIVVLGVALSSTKIYFNPSLSIVEHV